MARKTVLHAEFSGNSKGLVGAARLASFETNKLNAQLSDTKRKNEEAANSTEVLLKSLHKLKMETDSAYAGMTRYEKASTLVKRAADSQKWSDEQLGAELRRLAGHYNVTAAAGFSAGASMKSAGFHTANLGAQFNDIGVMLAAGQNPLMLAVQQGTQISQVLQAAGGTAKETGKLLLASFKSILSPISLATIGVIAVGAALFQWATSAGKADEAMEKSTKATEAYSESLDALEGDLSSASTIHDAYVEAFKAGSTEILGALTAEARARQAIMGLDLLDAQEASKAASGKVESQKLVVAGLADELAMQKKLVESTAANAASVPATVPGGKSGTVASPEAAAARMVLAEYERQNKELQAQQAILARSTAEFDVLDSKLALITAKMAATKDILNVISGGLPPIVDGFQIVSDSSAATAAAEEKQIALANLKKNLFHQLAGEYAAVSTSSLSTLDTAAKIAQEEQKQTALAQLKKNLFHQLAGEYSAVNTTAFSIANTAAKIAAEEQKQADLIRLRINYFHQLAGEYSAVNTTALSMVDAAAKIAASEQQQAELAQLKKNYFHLLAGETSAVSMFLAASSVSAQQLADANLVGPIAAAANTAMTLTQQLGYSYDIVKKLMAGGYEVPGPVIFNPMDPNYDAARAAAAGGLRTQYTPDAPKAESTGGADTFATELEQLQNSLKSQEQLELESYQRRQEVLNTALAQKLLTQQEYAGLIEQSEAQHNFAMLKETNAGISSTLNSLGQLFEGSKQVSAGIALANSYLAFTEVLKDQSYAGRPFARFAAAAAALSSGLAAVRSIKSAQPGGGGGGGTGSGGSAGGGGATGGAATTSTQVSLQLVGGDLYSRDQVLQLINAINSATADGAQILLR